MAEDERKVIFDFLNELKIKPGETLKESLFRQGAIRPSFVITEKIDGTFTLYEMEENKLKKIQTAQNLKTLADLVIPILK